MRATAAGRPETVQNGDASAGLLWPIKASFVAYVLGMDDGELEAGNGATVSASHVFAFEPAPTSGSSTGGTTFDASTRQGTLRFRGEVRFTAHFGLLSVQISDPFIEFGTESVVLSAATDGQRILLATLTLPEAATHDSHLSWRGVVPRLSSAGSSLFNGVYPPGQELDLLDITVDLSH
jgi:hypothetical protein